MHACRLSREADSEEMMRIIQATVDVSVGDKSFEELQVMVCIYTYIDMFIDICCSLFFSLSDCSVFLSFDVMHSSASLWSDRRAAERFAHVISSFYCHFYLFVCFCSLCFQLLTLIFLQSQRTLRKKGAGVKRMPTVRFAVEEDSQTRSPSTPRRTQTMVRYAFEDMMTKC